MITQPIPPIAAPDGDRFIVGSIVALPSVLADFSIEAGLTLDEIRMLAGIHLDGERPRTAAGYRHLWAVIREVCQTREERSA